MSNKKIRLAGRAMDLADYHFGRYGVKVPAQTTLEDVLNPIYFQAYLNLLNPGTIIEVLSDDFALDVTLRVTTVTKTTLKCRVLREFVSEEPSEEPTKFNDNELPEGFEVSHGGPHHRWRYLHNGDIVDKGFGTKGEAIKAALEYAEKAT